METDIHAYPMGSYSCAHLQDMSMDDIPEELITDCAQLVKANSIMGL